MTCAHQDDDWRTTMLSAAQFCGYASAWGTQRDTEREREREIGGDRGLESWESIAFGFLGYIHRHTHRDRHESAIKLATASSSENGSACNLIYFNCSRIITTGDKVPLQPQQFHSLPLSLNLFPPLSFSPIPLSVKLFINKFWREETKRSKRQFQLNRHALPLPRPSSPPLHCSVCT